MIAGFDTTFRLERNAGGMDFALTAKHAGSAVGNAAISGTVRGLTSETNIEIDAQTLTLFTVRFLDVEGEIKIEAGGVELGLFDRKIQIPARLSLPVTVYGIPFRVDLGAGLEWASTLTASTSAIFDGAVKFKGGVGARIQDGEVAYLATFDTSEVTLGKREHVGTVTAGMGILLNFPEIGFGIGYPRAIDASASFKFKSEVLSNFALRYESWASARHHGQLHDVEGEFRSHRGRQSLRHWHHCRRGGGSPVLQARAGENERQRLRRLSPRSPGGAHRAIALPARRELMRPPLTR